MYKYDLITYSGTFDHLHKGHKYMLKEAFRLGKTVIIGITSNDFIKDKKLSYSIQPLNIRKKELIAYLRIKNLYKRTKLIVLNDIYGPGPFIKELQAILVTKDTLENAIKINEKRTKNNLQKLNIEIRDLVKDKNNLPIRSERIRSSKINRYGNLYLHKLTDIFGTNTTLKLPKEIYPALRKPFGDVYTNLNKVIKYIQNNIYCTKSLTKDKITNNRPLLITIGDVISDNLINKGVTPDVYIIDYKNKRKRIKAKERYKQLKEFINKAGTLSLKTCLAIYKAINKNLLSKSPIIIPIRGEEDLLTIPSVLFAPLGSLILYGQKDLGIVVVKIDEEVKKKVIRILTSI